MGSSLSLKSSKAGWDNRLTVTLGIAPPMLLASQKDEQRRKNKK